MNDSSHRLTPYHCNILALDGGGVRGLSSLLILQALMQYINTKFRSERGAEKDHEDLEPHDVFDLVAGTSTGGLIALMLGKLGMTLKESIKAYHELSQSIFDKKHFRGRITHGLAPSKYVGSRLRQCIQELIRSKGFAVTMPMVSDDNTDKIACAVLCREHEHESRYSPFKEGAVPICSLPCYGEVACLVSEAARATSAAPTFFPVQKIGSRYFVDGGMEYNNPSAAIIGHYVMPYRRSRGPRNILGATTSVAHHDQLDLTSVRFVNLGTGTKSKNLPPLRRDRFAHLVPGFIRMGLFMKTTLTEFAVNSENIAEHMTTLAETSSRSISYERFSASNGVCYVKLDKYQELDRIEKLTLDYLQTDEIRERLRKVGEEIASDYLQKHYPAKDNESRPPPSLPVSGSIALLSQAATSRTSHSRDSATTNSSGEDSQDCQHQLTIKRDFAVSSNSSIPSSLGAHCHPVDGGTGKMETMAGSTMLGA